MAALSPSLSRRPSNNVEDPTDPLPPVAKTYHDTLKHFLSDRLKQDAVNGPSEQRKSAREKLRKLNKRQFFELATDVQDETKRRLENSPLAPFLPVNNDFHPTRNQARQKLATLPVVRFTDLASDVFHELERRCPESSGVQRDKNLPDFPPPTQLPLPVPLTSSTPSLVDTHHPQPVSFNRRPTLDSVELHRTKSDGHDDMGSVNFQSLDTLMADLGNLMGTGRSSPAMSSASVNGQGDVPKMTLTGHPTTGNSMAEESLQRAVEKESSREVERLKEENRAMKAEYEKKIARLETTLRDLETSISGFHSQQTQMQEKLKKAEEAVKYYKQEENSWREKIAATETKYAELEKEVNNYRKTASDAKAEVTKMVTEMTSLKFTLEQTARERDEAMKASEETRSLKQQLKGSQDQIDTLKKTLRAAEDAAALAASTSASNVSLNASGSRLNMGSPLIPRESVSRQSTANSLPAPAPVSAPESKPSTPNRGSKPTAAPVNYSSLKFAFPSTTFSPSGIVSEKETSAYEEICVKLLKEAAGSNPSGVLMSLKELVMATRSFLDTTDKISPVPATLEDDKENVQEAVANLMHITKRFASEGPSASGVEDIQVALRQVLDKTQKLITVCGIQKGDLKKIDPEELRVFLEKQTDLIVQNIQSLLQVMRQSTFGHEFSDTISGITTVVENLTTVTTDTMKDPRFAHMKEGGRGDYVLNRLTLSKKQLEELSEAMVTSTGVRPSKQKIAAAAYEVAKHTKELVALYELDT